MTEFNVGDTVSFEGVVTYVQDSDFGVQVALDHERIWCTRKSLTLVKRASIKPREGTSLTGVQVAEAEWPINSVIVGNRTGIPLVYKGKVQYDHTWERSDGLVFRDKNFRWAAIDVYRVVYVPSE